MYIAIEGDFRSMQFSIPTLLHLSDIYDLNLINYFQYKLVFSFSMGIKRSCPDNLIPRVTVRCNKTNGLYWYHREIGHYTFPYVLIDSFTSTSGKDVSSTSSNHCKLMQCVYIVIQWKWFTERIFITIRMKAPGNGCYGQIMFLFRRQRSESCLHVLSKTGTRYQVGIIGLKTTQLSFELTWIAEQRQHVAFEISGENI